MFQRLLLDVGVLFLGDGLGRDEDFLVAIADPAPADLVVAVSLFRLAAVDHVVMEQVVVARDLPDLRMHDDRAVEARHGELARRSRRNLRDVVADDHVPPPGFLDVPLEFHAQRAVIPEALESAVDVARLKEEAAALGERNEFVHLHDGKAFCVSSGSVSRDAVRPVAQGTGGAARAWETGSLPERPIFGRAENRMAAIQVPAASRAGCDAQSASVSRQSSRNSAISQSGAVRRSRSISAALRRQMAHGVSK